MTDESDERRNFTAELTDEERAALFHDHFRPICEIDDEIAELNERKKKLKRLAKNDGIPSEDINWALKARRAEDTSLIVDALRRQFNIARYLHFIPAGVQLDMFDDRRSDEERAYGKGAVAATFNRKPSPEVDGYQTGSPEGQAWLRGFNSEADGRAAALAAARAKMTKMELDGTAYPGAEGDGDADGEPEPEAPARAGKKKPAGKNQRRLDA